MPRKIREIFCLPSNLNLVWDHSFVEITICFGDAIVSFGLRQSLKTSSVKSQIVNILCFVGYIIISVASSFSSFSSFNKPLRMWKSFLTCMLYKNTAHGPPCTNPWPKRLLTGHRERPDWHSLGSVPCGLGFTVCRWSLIQVWTIISNCCGCLLGQGTTTHPVGGMEIFLWVKTWIFPLLKTMKSEERQPLDWGKLWSIHLGLVRREKPHGNLNRES